MNAEAHMNKQFMLLVDYYSVGLFLLLFQLHPRNSMKVTHPLNRTRLLGSLCPLSPPIRNPHLFIANNSISQRKSSLANLLHVAFCAKAAISVLKEISFFFKKYHPLVAESSHKLGNPVGKEISVEEQKKLSVI